MGNKKVLSVTEAAATLGLSKNSTYEAIARGDLPAIRVGRRILVPKAALDRILSGPSAVADELDR